MSMLVRGTLLTACLLFIQAVAHAQGISPDGAVGSMEERLGSAIDFETTGTFTPGEGFVAKVRLSWTGTAGYKVRSVYRDLTADALRDRAVLEAARSGFFNYVVTSARLEPAPVAADLPQAIDYDVREAMSFGVGGRPWSFWVPVPRVMRRLAPTRSPLPTIDLPAGDPARLVLEATPPVGRLPVAEVGRWAVRARYDLAPGVYAAAPVGRQIDTDFAAFRSRYAVEGRVIVLERSLQAKQLTIDPSREAELRQFYEAVEADKRQEFAITPYAPGAATVADRLNEEGLALLDRRDFSAAAKLFEQATAADPHHRWAWHNLAASHQSRGDASATITACQRALDAYPENPFATIMLGQAYWMAQRFADAEATFQAQIARTPASTAALRALAEFYAGRQELARSVDYWRRAAEAAPRDEAPVLELGRTYLLLNRPDDAAKAYVDGLKPSRNHNAFNNAAYELADRGVALQVARDLIERGLGILVQRLTQPEMFDEPPMTAEMLTGLAAPMWDTAGWVAFKRGQTDLAAAWLRAGWALSGAPPIGQHLGDVLAADGHVDEAARVYAAVVAAQPNDLAVASKLAELAPDGIKALVSTARAAAAPHPQEVPSATSTAPWKGDITVIHDRAGVVLDLRPAAGATLPTGVAGSLRGIVVPFQAPPDERPYRLARRAALECPGAGLPCALALAPSGPPGR